MLLVVGSVAFDAVKTPFGQVERALGGSATYFSVAASLFTEVSLVAVVGEDFTLADRQVFNGRRIDLSGLESRPGKTFFWRGEYGFDLNDAKTLDTQLNVFADFDPVIPPALRAPDALFLANIHPALQLKVLEQVQRPKLVVLDTMNFWIRSQKAALIEVIKRVDMVVLNDAETREIAGEANLYKAARAIRALGPKRLVVKRGEYGALLFDGDHIFSLPAFPLENTFDPTGAGDSFAGGLMGYLAESGAAHGKPLREAMSYGSVVASFTVEAFSLGKLAVVSRDEVEARRQQFLRLTRYDG
jgi:sugar/nucleoside kinase (ribokinase family)